MFSNELRPEGEPRPEGNGDRSAHDAAFRRILVVVDGTESARTAATFAGNWARDSGAETRFVELAERRSVVRSRLITDVEPKSHTSMCHVTTGAPTLQARNRRLVEGVAVAARTFGADVIVLGVERGRMVRHRFARSFRAQLAKATDLPVMIPPPLVDRAPVSAEAPDARVARTRYVRV